MVAGGIKRIALSVLAALLPPALWAIIATCVAYPLFFAGLCCVLMGVWAYYAQGDD